MSNTTLAQMIGARYDRVTGAVGELALSDMRTADGVLFTSVMAEVLPPYKLIEIAAITDDEAFALRVDEVLLRFTALLHRYALLQSSGRA